MIPANYDLGFQIGATFEPRILLALDDNMEPVDLAGFVPYATVKDEGNGAVVVDLTPMMVTPGLVAGPVFVIGGPQFICFGHGLVPGLNIKFVTDGTLPSPLRASERYIVISKGFTPNVFQVIGFHAALNGFEEPVQIRTAGSGTLQAFRVPGQILLPEITDETTGAFTEEHDAFWDLMLQDPVGRRLAPAMRGRFPIKFGFTDP